MNRILIAVVAVAVVAMADIATAVNTNVVVRAQVVGTCRVSNAAPVMNFGNLLYDANGDPQARTIFGFLDFWCTKNAAFSVTDDDGQNESGTDKNRMASTTLGTPEYIDYTFAYTPTFGVGAGAHVDTRLDFTIEVGPTYGDNSPDVYRDVVVVTIAP